MSNELAEKIKTSVKLRDVMEFHGVQFDSRGFAKCPFHTEKTASLSIKNERYKCFGCGAYGSVIDFIMNYCGLNFYQAMVKLDSDWHLDMIGKKQDYRSRIQEAQNAQIQRAEVKWKETLHQEYLTICEVRSILYGRVLSGEEWLSEVVRRLDILLDDFTGEEARAWQMAITPYTPENIS